jgi:transposase
VAASKFGVNKDSLHLDSSSFHVHGAYLSQDLSPSEEPAAIAITHGYSRDHRSDLKQFIVDLMCSGDGDVPLYLRVADGNESDQALHRPTDERVSTAVGRGCSLCRRCRPL